MSHHLTRLVSASMFIIITSARQRTQHSIPIIYFCIFHTLPGLLLLAVVLMRYCVQYQQMDACLVCSTAPGLVWRFDVFLSLSFFFLALWLKWFCLLLLVPLRCSFTSRCLCSARWSFAGYIWSVYISHRRQYLSHSSPLCALILTYHLGLSGWTSRPVAANAWQWI